MSQHQSQNGPGYDEDGHFPDLSHTTTAKTIKNAAKAAQRRTGKVPDHIVAELIGPEPLHPFMVTIKIIDHETHVYCIRALLRNGLSQHIVALLDTDLNQFTELTQVGRGIIHDLRQIFGVNFVAPVLTEVRVDIAGDFDWDDDEHIHDQIMAILAKHLGVDQDDLVVRTFDTASGSFVVGGDESYDPTA